MISKFASSFFYADMAPLSTVFPCGMVALIAEALFSSLEKKYGQYKIRPDYGTRFLH